MNGAFINVMIFMGAIVASRALIWMVREMFDQGMRIKSDGEDSGG